MKTYIVVFLASLTIYATSCRKEIEPVTESVYDYNISEIPNLGIVLEAGGAAHFLKTEDQGVNWTQSTGYPDNLFASVVLNTPNTAVAVGNDASNNAVAIISDDDGKTWQPISVPTSKITGTGLTSVAFGSSLSGIAVGSELVYSGDGGHSWKKSSYPNYYRVFTSVAFSSPTNAVAVGYSNIFKTVDAGANWTEVNNPTKSYLSSVAFTSTKNGIAVGYNGTILQTADGGTTWTSIITNDFSDINFLSLAFSSATQGIAVGNDQYQTSYIVQTTDAGVSWHIVDNPYSNFFLANVNFSNAADGIIVGGYNNSTILKTSNGGTTWQYINHPDNKPLTSVAFSTHFTPYNY
ncbi:MAG: YCF48-related protein [Phycisphaerales bacterium]|nr:YCF48-related protein [Phycisphaerales bacterium]